MKKVSFMLLILSLFIVSDIKAKETVTLSKCVDGDTAWFYLNNEEIKTRFLAIDTPESTTEKEEYGKEASEFTCNNLKSAQKIEIEYDNNSDKTDKYDRHLVWVFVDEKLLQDLIVKEGLADVAYLYGDYKYTETLQSSLKIAKANKINMWSNTNNYELYITIGIVIVIIIAYIFSSSIRKKVNNRIKNKIKKEINKKIDNIF